MRDALTADLPDSRLSLGGVRITRNYAQGASFPELYSFQLYVIRFLGSGRLYVLVPQCQTILWKLVSSKTNKQTQNFGLSICHNVGLLSQNSYLVVKFFLRSLSY